MNGQSAAKPLLNEEGSTTIPRKGSKLENILIEKPDIVFKPLFSRFSNKTGQGIYAIVTLHNDKFYVGRASCFQKRFRKHRELLVKGSHYCKYLQRVYNKYGKEDVYILLLEYCDINFQQERELYWITYFDAVTTGYNAVFDTSVNFLNKETIAKNTERNSLAVMCFKENGDFFKEFSSISDASRYFNTSSSNISRCCRKVFNHIKKHIFVYKNEYDSNIIYNRKPRDFSYKQKESYKLNMSISLKKAIATKNRTPFNCSNI